MGKMHIRHFRIFAILLTLLLAAGCAALFPTEDELLPEPLVETQRIEYKTYPVQRKDIENAVTGYAVVAAQNQTDVSATYAYGKVSVIHIKEGDWVEEGQLLLETENDDIKEEVEEYRLITEIAELRFAKMQEMYKNGEIDLIAWKQAQLDIMRARREMQKREEKLSATQYFAPVSGYIVYRRDIKIGEAVGSDPFCTIADPSDLLLVYKGSRAEDLPLGAICEGVLRDDPEKKVYRLEVVESTMGTRSANPKLKPIDPLPDNVRLGAQMDIKCVLEKSENTIVVPRRAIQTMNKRTFVYVMADGYKQERDVKIGVMSSDEAEILSGLSDDDQLIY